MAVGLARMFGIRLPINFDSPLRATGIIDFYKRWHITLTRVIVRFLFTPLALWGTRRAFEWRLGRTSQKLISSWLPLLINFQVIALWHGALATFLVFGLVHGLWYILETEVRASRWWRTWSKTQPGDRLTAYGQAITLVPLVLTFALFASPSLSSYGLLLESLFLPPTDTSAMTFQVREWALIAAGFAIVWLMPNSTELLARYRPGLLSWPNPSTTPAVLVLRWRPDLAWAAFMLLLITAAIYSQSQKSPFLYQGF
jgi:D-alanyl-lipoteichoic acid acyltransferase DltB (MBOAT superfamily)